MCARYIYIYTQYVCARYIYTQYRGFLGKKIRGGKSMFQEIEGGGGGIGRN